MTVEIMIKFLGRTTFNTIYTLSRFSACFSHYDGHRTTIIYDVFMHIVSGTAFYFLGNLVGREWSLGKGSGIFIFVTVFSQFVFSFLLVHKSF